MDVDPTNAARALRQRPQLMEGLRNILSEESTSPEVNRPQSAYDKIGEMREDVFGVDSDDGLLTRAAKGLGNAVVSPLALGAAGGDYLKAGFNELTGNDEGLQFEDTPGASDIIGDGINTALAAATGGTGNIIKAGVGNLVKNGIKNTLGKAKGKVLGSATGKALLGGPKRRLATGIGAASLLGAPEESSDEGVADDIIDTAPEAPKESLSSADLDAPITNPVTGRQSPISLDSPSANIQAATPMQQAADLTNPAGLAAMSNNLGINRPIDPKDKSLEAFQRRGMQKDLNAQAARQIQRDIANQRRENRINDVFNSREQDLREAWLNSPSNKAGIPFDQLSPAEQMKMRENYMASRRAGSYSSADEAAEIGNRKALDKIADSGGYAVNYRDPENKRGLRGQTSIKELENKKALDNPASVSTPAPTKEPKTEPTVFDEGGDGNPFYINDWGPAALLGATLLSRGAFKPKLKSFNQKALPNKTFPANGGLPQKSLSKEQWNAMRSGTNPSGQNVSSAANIMSANRPTLKQTGQSLRDPQGKLLPNDAVRRRLLDENLFR